MNISLEDFNALSAEQSRREVKIATLKMELEAQEDRYKKQTAARLRLPHSRPRRKARPRPTGLRRRRKEKARSPKDPPRPKGTPPVREGPAGWGALVNPLSPSLPVREGRGERGESAFGAVMKKKGRRVMRGPFLRVCARVRVHYLLRFVVRMTRKV